MKVIGIVNIINNEKSYFTTYFLKEFFSHAINRGLQLPTIIVDNISTLENKSSAYADESQSINIVNELGRALELLINSNANKVAILCNVAHLYARQIILTFPNIEPYFVDVVEGAVISAQNADIKDVLVLCSENAQKSKLFDGYFFNVGISVHYAKNDQDTIHSIMCAVENNFIDDMIACQLYNLCSKYRNYSIYFACTELSVIYGKNRSLFTEFDIIDTIDCVIQQLCQILIDQ